MKLNNGRITILFDHDGMSIELHDYDASLTFAAIRLTPEQTVKAFSRLGYTECDIEVKGLDKIGSKMENKHFEFEIPDVGWGSKRTDTAIRIVQEVCPEGWEPDLYFQSQNSFFSKDGQDFARTIIRRWVKNIQ